MYPELSKIKVKYIRQLALKKYRSESASFVLEGKKSIQSLLSSGYEIKFIVGTASFFKENPGFFIGVRKEIEVFEVRNTALSHLGSFSNNHDLLAVVTIPKPTDPVVPSVGITLALDDIRDPGNLGTIIRIADWYGIQTILCSQSTVDLYNPKVLQASMGSFVNVNLPYVDLSHYLGEAKCPIIGAVLAGKNIHDFSFPDSGILVIGNESNGIQHSVKRLLTHAVAIPGYGSMESLNAAIATAIACDNWKRVTKKIK
ncbi:RNA methyltransferase [Cardinium endosymbiont of Tipula unca]|uniref:RNA methyltransferase n=1 Tax=Cardinium endosymbiont of Tipula unca TaxID=3066216 RepID=UPI0030CF8AC7